ncbi:hypothetical protein ABPG75_008077 [Micractinium tetrahymenae]
MASAVECPLPAYHERQRLQRCLQHSLNNLLQRPAVGCADLDELANQLAPGRALQPLFHPHRTLFLGNWDVNVLELALQRHGKELQWHDLRDASFQKLDLDACFGLILNIRADGMVTRLLGGRHWVALRRLGGRWWNLDSSLPAPQLVAACSGSSRLDAEAEAASSSAPEPPGQSEQADWPAAAAAAGGSSGEPSSGEAHGGSSSAGSMPAAADGASAAAGGVAAGDAAAVRQFLMHQVRDMDAKVFCVLDSLLASHPLPAAVVPSHPLRDDGSRSSADGCALPADHVKSP